MPEQSEAEFRRIWGNGTLVILPPPEVARVVDELRRRHDPRSADIIGAHITLTQPFLREPDAADLARIAAVVAEAEPFTIDWGPLNTFLPYPCIHFEVHPIEAVSRLRGALHALGLFNVALPFSGDDFIPHMTITEGYLDAAETRRLFDELRNSAPSGTFPCTTVTYSAPDRDFRFQPRASFPLGGAVS